MKGDASAKLDHNAFQALLGPAINHSLPQQCVTEVLLRMPGRRSPVKHVQR
jgi:hypothetical protein